MAGIYPSSIVTAAHLPELNNKIARVKQAQVEQGLAMQAGIGKAENTQRLADALDKLMTFKRVYFPGA